MNPAQALISEDGRPALLAERDLLACDRLKLSTNDDERTCRDTFDSDADGAESAAPAAVAKGQGMACTQQRQDGEQCMQSLMKSFNPASSN